MIMEIDIFLIFFKGEAQYEGSRTYEEDFSNDSTILGSKN